MTKEQMAEKLQGVDAFDIPKALIQELKDAGLAIIYGMSDDLVEIDGAIRDDAYAWNGGTILIDRKGVLPSFDDICSQSDMDAYYSRRDAAATVTAVWGPANSLAPWVIESSMPHTKVELTDDGEPWCQAIVIDINDLKSSPKETYTTDIAAFMRAAGQSTKGFNVRQTALYIGLQLEEMAEVVESATKEWHGAGTGIMEAMTSNMRLLSDAFKDGSLDESVASADRAHLLRETTDLSWVAIAGALSQGADVIGAQKEMARANMAKAGPDGQVIRDKTGKIQKPDGWTPPRFDDLVSA